MKTLQNNFTTPEQSKRLLELGVPADSADCIGFICRNNYDLLRKGIYISVLHDRDTYTKAISPDEYGGQPVEEPFPCWSVGRLMEIIDICALGENSNPDMEEYPTTIKIMNKLHIPYVEYLAKSMERAEQLGTIDFSKLGA